jgi:hypothetical protein
MNLLAALGLASVTSVWSPDVQAANTHMFYDERRGRRPAERPGAWAGLNPLLLDQLSPWPVQNLADTNTFMTKAHME